MRTKNRLWIGFSAFLILAMVLMGLGFVPSFTDVAQAKDSGAIWTTTGSCGSPQNVNHYPAGSEVFINAANFLANTQYHWEIRNPGANGTVVASGNVTTDSNGKFCVDAGVIPSGGPYQVKITDPSGHTSKGDNFSVDQPETHTWTASIFWLKYKNTWPAGWPEDTTQHSWVWKLPPLKDARAWADAYRLVGQYHYYKLPTK